MTRTTDPAAVLDEKIETLRELIREANGTLRDIRHERREAEASIRSITEQIDARIFEAVVAGLERYSGTISNAIEVAEQKVYDRFDMIACLCLGQEQDDGTRPLEELIRRYVALNGPCTGSPFGRPFRGVPATYRRKQVNDDDGAAIRKAAAALR